ncbi:MAG: hypothetical protein P1Q69_02050, partial [Candidatus Thorarchaeota archaeon]|nr:hypothetical protein [Candidatus Thorarchaeota archaeon]
MILEEDMTPRPEELANITLCLRNELRKSSQANMGKKTPILISSYSLANRFILDTWNVRPGQRQRFKKLYAAVRKHARNLFSEYLSQGRVLWTVNNLQYGFSVYKFSQNRGIIVLGFYPMITEREREQIEIAIGDRVSLGTEDDLREINHGLQIIGMGDIRIDELNDIVTSCKIEDVPPTSWNQFITTLSDHHSENHKLANPEFGKETITRISEGTIRNFIIEYLGLHLLNGLDGNLIGMFRGIQGSTRRKLKQEAFNVAMQYISKQVKEENTFFIDVDRMSETPELVKLVPDIIEVRNRQILNLVEHPSLMDVCSTYYGFKIITTGTYGRYILHRGILNESIKEFS